MLDYFQITQTRRAGHCFNYWDTWSGTLIPHPFCIAGNVGLKIWLFNLDSGRWWDLCPAPIPAEVHSLSKTVVSNISLGNIMDELCMLCGRNRRSWHPSLWRLTPWYPSTYIFYLHHFAVSLHRNSTLFYSVSITSGDYMRILWILHQRHKVSYKPTSMLKVTQKANLYWSDLKPKVGFDYSLFFFFSQDLMEKTFKLSSGLYGFRLVY